MKRKRNVAVTIVAALAVSLILTGSVLAGWHYYPWGEAGPRLPCPPFYPWWFRPSPSLWIEWLLP